MRKHDPFEVLRDSLKNMLVVYFRGCHLGNEFLECFFRLEKPDALVCIAQFTGRDINQHKRTDLEDLVDGRIDSDDRLARSGIIFS